MSDAPPPNMIQLAPILDLNAAGPLAHALGGVRGHDVEIDASAVRRVGAQCLQVLVAARDAWRSDGHGFTLAQPSEEFTTGLAILGAPVDTWFNPVEPS